MTELSSWDTKENEPKLITSDTAPRVCIALANHIAGLNGVDMLDPALTMATLSKLRVS